MKRAFSADSDDDDRSVRLKPAEYLHVESLHSYSITRSWWNRLSEPSEKFNLAVCAFCVNGFLFNIDMDGVSDAIGMDSPLAREPDGSTTWKTWFRDNELLVDGMFSWADTPLRSLFRESSWWNAQDLKNDRLMVQRLCELWVRLGRPDIVDWSLFSPEVTDFLVVPAFRYLRKDTCGAELEVYLKQARVGSESLRPVLVMSNAVGRSISTLGLGFDYSTMDFVKWVVSSPNHDDEERQARELGYGSHRDQRLHFLDFLRAKDAKSCAKRCIPLLMKDFYDERGGWKHRFADNLFFAVKDAKVLAEFFITMDVALPMLDFSETSVLGMNSYVTSLRRHTIKAVFEKKKRIVEYAQSLRNSFLSTCIALRD